VSFFDRLDPDPLEEARREIRFSTKQEIEAKTARTWAARAVASYEMALAQKSADPDRALASFADGVVYEHEALEHASEAGAELVAELRSFLDAWKRTRHLP
jgi:hypothetical protein